MKTIPSKVRIKDIAQRAGVSVGTVDRVLHGRPNVSAASKAKVDKVLNEIDYHPNRMASALARTKDIQVICLLPHLPLGGYWNDVIQGIKLGEQAFADFRLNISITFYDPYNYYSFEQAGQEIITASPDGVILVPPDNKYTARLIDQLEIQSIPFVYLDSEYKARTPLAFFGQHPQKSGFFAAKMLMLLNPQERPVLSFRKKSEGVVGSYQQVKREEGFLEYMHTFHKGCPIHTLDLPAKHPEEDDTLLEIFFAQHPNAYVGVFFNSNSFILAHYLRKKQPHKDFHVIGYDLLAQNIEALQGGSIDFLIAQDPERQGYKSVQTLCEYILFKREPTHTIHYMPIHLISKETLPFHLNNKLTDSE